MKHIIALLFIIAAFIAVLYTGFWSINEQNKQYEYDQRNNVGGGRDNLVPDEDVQVSGTDPFGLFGPSEMTYEVTIVTDWSSRNHDGFYPNTAHLSQPVFWTAGDNPVFSIGSYASAGMQEFTSSGRTRALKQELDEMIDKGTIEQFEIIDRIDAPGQDSFTVTLSRDKSVLSIISKLSPSPDWFVALEGLDMLEDKRWKNNARVSMVALDGGVALGSEFTQSDIPSENKELIQPLTDIKASALPPFAYVRLRQVVK